MHPTHGCCEGFYTLVQCVMAEAMTVAEHGPLAAMAAQIAACNWQDSDLVTTFTGCRGCLALSWAWAISLPQGTPAHGN